MSAPASHWTRALLAAFLAASDTRDELMRLSAVNTLFDEGKIVENFSNMERVFLTVPLSRGDGPVTRLPQGPAMVLPEGAEEWIEAPSVTSLRVLDAAQHVVPADWVAASTRASAPTLPGKTGYGYPWWIPVAAPKGVFFARGIYGQYIYIDQARDVVIVVTAADRQFRVDGVHEANIAMMRRIAEAL